MRLSARASLCSGLAGCLLLGVVPSPVLAVVVTTPFDAPTLVAPGNDPGWNNVARMSGASAVYLGNRWMITANHVSDAPVRFSDGRTFNIVPASDFVLSTPNSPSNVGADLRMFRLTADPGLPALSIAESSPTGGTQVTMIGASRDRAPDLVGWSVNSLSQWTQGPLPLDNDYGYLLLDSSHMRWGMNQVMAGAPTYLSSINTFVFSTRYDRIGIPFEAQAALGDSGGGVFELVGGAWKLAGLMNTVEGPVANQPNLTVAFGDQTHSADLSVYRSQIMGLVNSADPAWQNPVNPYDVNNSGRVSARDVLMLAAALQQPGLGGPLPIGRIATDPFYDVNGDGSMNATDAILLINALLRGTANPVTSASPLTGNFVPEPSSAVLGLSAALTLLVGRAVAARRKRRRARFGTRLPMGPGKCGNPA
jgi:hypothetical protein